MAERERMTAEQVVAYPMEDDGADFLRESLRFVVEALMEAEVSELIGAAHGARRTVPRTATATGCAGTPGPASSSCASRSCARAATSRRFWSRAGAVSRRCWRSSSRPMCAGSRPGGWTSLVESLGLRISRSEVSRICAQLDEQVQAFLERPLEGDYPYLWLDAKLEKVRDGGCVVGKAVVIAYGVHETGRREILGVDVGAAETEAFWTEFVRALVARGLSGVQLVVSDAHGGLKGAIARLLSCPWQRCTVHFLRDCLGHARRDQHGLLGADQADLSSRLASPGARPAVRGRRPPRRQAAQGRRAARAGRAGHPRLLLLPDRALVQAQIDG
jgi:putative transposase